MSKNSIINFIILYYKRRKKQLNIKKKKMEEMNTLELIRLLR